MDIAMLAPAVAKWLGIAPSTLVLLILALNRGGAIVARKIPNDAVGFWGFVRQFAAIIGTEVPTVLTKGVTVADAAKAAILTPPVAQKVEETTGIAVSSESGPGNPENQQNRHI